MASPPDAPAAGAPRADPPSEPGGVDAAEQREAALLVEAAQRGERAAWTALVERFQSLVYAIPRELGLAEEDCRDVFQSTWEALYRRLPDLRSPRVLPAWIQTTARRLAERTRRKTQRAQGLDPEELSLETPLATPEEEVLQHELRVAVHAALDELPPRCRELLARLFLAGDDPSYQAVSEELGIPVGSIGPTRARCLARLHALLARRGIEP